MVSFKEGTVPEANMDHPSRITEAAAAVFMSPRCNVSGRAPHQLFLVRYRSAGEP